ncbi:hypothetical protein EKH77_24805 [Streptomyces luteoverticillatus]|uniref:Uncharacterized protein n=1 Tax=Streptomyces luteoverticillatus TaxID=66425 RepID=A0A3Q9G1S1_STRLT|nr:hypothetical protein EKH77_24805 [Streptomyces luteoverticillatus]
MRSGRNPPRRARAPLSPGSVRRPRPPGLFDRYSPLLLNWARSKAALTVSLSRVETSPPTPRSPLGSRWGPSGDTSPETLDTTGVSRTT